MKTVICECGKDMQFDSLFFPGIEESEDFFICKCGEKKDYYSAIEE